MRTLPSRRKRVVRRPEGNEVTESLVPEGHETRRDETNAVAEPLLSRESLIRQWPGDCGPCGCFDACDDVRSNLV